MHEGIEKIDGEQAGQTEDGVASVSGKEKLTEGSKNWGKMLKGVCVCVRVCVCVVLVIIASDS